MGYPEDTCSLRVIKKQEAAVTFTFRQGEGEQINSLYPSRPIFFDFSGFPFFKIEPKREGSPPTIIVAPDRNRATQPLLFHLAPNFQSLGTRPPRAYPIQNLTAGQAAPNPTILNTIFIVGVIYLFILFVLALICYFI